MKANQKTFKTILKIMFSSISQNFGKFFELQEGPQIKELKYPKTRLRRMLIRLLGHARSL